MPEEFALFFDFHGAGLTIIAPDAGWASYLRDGFRWYSVEAELAPSFTVTITQSKRPAAPALPKSMPRTWSGRLAEGVQAAIHEDEARSLLDMGEAGWLLIDHERAQAEAVMPSGSCEAFSMTPLSRVLAAALEAKGRQIVHGASLGRPDGAGAVLICAPSGYGKTTTTLALARSGWRMFGDDLAIFIPAGDGPPLIGGLPNRLRIHRNTLALLPWLGPLPDNWNAAGEQAVTIDSLAGRIDVVRAKPALLSAIVMIGPRAANHRVRPMSRAEALVMLAKDNVSYTAHNVRPWHQRQYAAFADAIRKCPVFELNAGPALDSLGGVLGEALVGQAAIAT
jgi:hypothetical protein